MEQSTLTSEQSRWAGAIAKLTSLTYTGKLQWLRVDTGVETMNTTPVTDLSFMSSKYEAELTGQKFSLIVSKPSLSANGFWSELSGMRSLPFAPIKVNFRAFDQDGRKVIEMTGLSILNTLASAVESQATSRESSVLTAIENA
jgi:hypothetical protein